MRPVGLEPTTYRLWVGCSNQLSYGRFVILCLKVYLYFYLMSILFLYFFLIKSITYIIYGCNYPFLIMEYFLCFFILFRAKKNSWLQHQELFFMFNLGLLSFRQHPIHRWVYLRCILLIIIAMLLNILFFPFLYLDCIIT